MKPFFTIVVPWRADHVPEERFVKMLDSLIEQEEKDFELLIYHDGELPFPVPKKIQERFDTLGVELIITDEWYRDWGHSLRDLGIKAAKGEYVILVNSDNLLYNVLHRMKKSIIKSGKQRFYTFPLKMIGLKIGLAIDGTNKAVMYTTGKPEDSVILKGNPVPRSVDVMSIVARAEAWKSIGGWHRKDINSDGQLVLELKEKYGCVVEGKTIMGEHW